MAIKEHLREAQRHIDLAQAELDAMINGVNGNGVQVTHVLEIEKARRKGRVTTGVRQAGGPRTLGEWNLSKMVYEVLRPAGRPMTTAEMLEKSEGRYITSSPDPIGSVDLQLYRLSKTMPIKKVGPRTWQWIGE